MMNLGVPGVVAVGSNLAHKFGKAIVGARRHSELGHVDRKLGLYMLITALAGVGLATWVNKLLFAVDTGELAGSARSDLYISIVFVAVLSVISTVMLVDVYHSRRGAIPNSGALAEFFARLRLPPMISFPTADIRVSFWIVAFVGLLTGYLAGTIGVGGFLGVPAMIYILGVPITVAAGTELYLAVFMGAAGAASYAFNGLVDIRLTLMLYLGSLIGIHIGAYGSKVVSERLLRLVTGAVILLCVIARAVNVPVYLHELNRWNLSADLISTLDSTSKLLLFASGIGGVLVVLFAVIRAWRRERRLRRLVE
jgi:hypothetical protein